MRDLLDEYSGQLLYPEVTATLVSNTDYNLCVYDWRCLSVSVFLVVVLCSLFFVLVLLCIGDVRISFR